MSRTYILELYINSVYKIEGIVDGSASSISRGVAGLPF